MAETIQAIAALDSRHQANFRFAAMANVSGQRAALPGGLSGRGGGYSLAFELAELAQECFEAADTVEGRLGLLRVRLIEQLAAVTRAARVASDATGLPCKGIDLSLAPYPGLRSSAVRAVEMLNGSNVGSSEFLFSLFAIDNLLEDASGRAAAGGPQRNDALSCSEDSVLAERVGEGAVGIQDLLSYATLCGGGLDMLPVPLATPAPGLAALIDAVATAAHQRNQPLIVRLLPSSVDDNGLTRFDHPFIVNSRPLQLDAPAFCEQVEREVSFAPARAADVTAPEPRAALAAEA